MSQAPAAPPRPGPRAGQHPRQAQRCQDDDRHVDRGYPNARRTERSSDAFISSFPTSISCASSGSRLGRAASVRPASWIESLPSADGCWTDQGSCASPAHQRDAKEGLTGEGVSGQVPASAAAMQSWRLSILRSISWSGRVVFRWLAGPAALRRRWDGMKARPLLAPPSALPDEPIPSLCGHRFQYLQGAADPGGFEREVK